MLERDSIATAPQAAATLDVEILSGHAKELLERTTWTRESLVFYQQRELRKALRYAVDSSPYYRETISALVAREAPLTEFPVLTKRALMANFEAVVTDRRLTRLAIEEHLASPHAGSLMLGEYRAAATGGTSGERGIFIYINRPGFRSQPTSHASSAYSECSQVPAA